jgi:hypothetical protein
MIIAIYFSFKDEINSALFKKEKEVIKEIKINNNFNNLKEIKINNNFNDLEVKKVFTYNELKLFHELNAYLQ